MKPLRDPVGAMVAEVIEQTNADLPPGMRLSHAASTRLLGAGRTIDSLGLVTLLAALEHEVSRRFGVHVSLTGGDEDGVQDIETVGALTAYLRLRVHRTRTRTS